MTKIIELKVTNIMGAKDVAFAPNGESVTIGGENAQGKSSAIWALASALGGAKVRPEELLTQGAKEGSVDIELDEFDVELLVRDGKNPILKVRGKDGFPKKQEQTFLNSIFGNLSFDPGEFRTMPKEKRAQTLRELAGLDFSDLEERHQKAYEERTHVNRRGKEIKAKLEGRKLHEVPAAEVSVIELAKELEEANQHNTAIGQKKTRLTVIHERLSMIDIEIKRLQDEKQTLQIEQAETQQEVNRTPMIDTLAIKSKLESAEETNRKVRENNALIELQEQFKAESQKHKQLEAELRAVADEKEKRLSEAAMPIEELSVDGTDVFYRGVPFSQLSESEQWEISTAIGFALNKQSIVFLRNSGGLDSRSRERIRERANKCGVQLFLEVVDDQQDVQVLIHDGRVKENRLEVAA